MMACTISGQVEWFSRKTRWPMMNATEAVHSCVRTENVRAARWLDEPRLYQLFKGLNIFLKFTAQELAAFCIKALGVRDEHKKSA